MIRFKNFISEAKDKPNLGHAFEFILAAAMVSKFTDRDDTGKAIPLDNKSIKDTMSNYFAGWSGWHIEAGDGVEDVIYFDGEGIPIATREALRDPTFAAFASGKKTGLDIVNGLIATAIEAVNTNSTLIRLSTAVITNNKADEVTIKCVGTSGATKTKSDVDVYVNDRKIRAAGISVKLKGTKQIAQWSSRKTLENFVTGFNFFGMNVTLRDFNGVADALEQSDLNYVFPERVPATEWNEKITKVFPSVKAAFLRIASKYSTSHFTIKRNVDALTQGIVKSAKGQEDDIEIIKGNLTISTETFNVIGAGIQDAAKDGKLMMQVKEDGSSPIIDFSVDKDGTVYGIFQLRFRSELSSISTGYKIGFRFLVELSNDLKKYYDVLRSK